MSAMQDLRADVAGLITARFTRPGPLTDRGRAALLAEENTHA